MRKAISIFFLAIACMASAFAFYQPDGRYSGDGELIPIGSVLYEKFDDLFLLAGHTSPSTSRPWTVQEARVELSKLEETSLSGLALTLYREISEAIAEAKEYDIFLDISINPEIYIHTNQAFDLEEDWNYGYVRRSPLAYGGVNAYHRGLAFHIELTYGPARFGSDDTKKTLQEYVENDLGKTYQGVGSAENEYHYTASTFKETQVVSSSAIYGPVFKFNGLAGAEIDTPRNAYLTYAWDGISIGAYRAQKVWGRSRIGNFIYDEHIDRYHYVSTKVFNKKFGLDFTIMFPEQCLGSSNSTKSYGDTRRFFLTHRFDVQISDNMKFTMSENVMYLATNFADFQFMNPAIIYHNNINSAQFNAIAHIEFEYAPCCGLQLYSQLAVDQGSVPFFEDSSTEDLAAGLTLGAEYAFEAKGALVDLNLEAVYASPALYRRNAPDFIITNSSTIDTATGYLGIPYFTYIGFKYGGDTLAFRFDCEYKRDALRVYANETLLLKGEFGMYDKYTAAMFVGTFLYGDVSVGSITDAGLEYSFRLFDRLNCKAFLDACLVYASDDIDVQIACGLKMSYSGRN